MINLLQPTRYLHPITIGIHMAILNIICSKISNGMSRHSTPIETDHQTALVYVSGQAEAFGTHALLFSGLPS
jgi:hypothetical protein